MGSTSAGRQPCSPRMRASKEEKEVKGRQRRLESMSATRVPPHLKCVFPVHAAGRGGSEFEIEVGVKGGVEGHEHTLVNLVESGNKKYRVKRKTVKVCKICFARTPMASACNRVSES